MKAIHLPDPPQCSWFSNGIKLEPGSYFIAECPPGRFYLHFGCPCGTGHRSAIPLVIGPNPPNDKHTWGWNGERENITITPSIFMDQLPCKWHGFLENGKWRSV